MCVGPGPGPAQASLKSALPKKTPILLGIRSQNVPILREKGLLCLQFQACFLFAVIRLTSMIYICWQFAHSLSLYLPWFMSKSMHRVVLATSKSRNTPFQVKPLVEFTLKVTQRDAKTGKVCAVRCQFCSFFGREE